MAREGKHEKSVGLAEGECSVIIAGRSPIGSIGNEFVAQDGLRGIRDIKDPQGDAAKRAIGVSGSAHREQVILAKHVDVLTEPGQFEFAQHLWVLGVAQVDRKEWVNLAKGDQVAGVLEKAGCIDRFARGQIGRRADLGERVRPDPQGVDAVDLLGSPDVVAVVESPPDGGRDAQHIVADVKRELIVGMPSTLAESI